MDSGHWAAEIRTPRLVVDNKWLLPLLRGDILSHQLASHLLAIGPNRGLPDTIIEAASFWFGASWSWACKATIPMIKWIIQ